MDTAQTAKQLMKDLEEIDAQIQQHGNILKQNNIGMDEPLLDENGFPRNDVDIYAVRTARHAIICLQNDRKQKMDQIEVELHKIHAEARKEQNGEESAPN